MRKDLHVTQGSLSATVDDNMRHKMDRFMRARDHKEIARKAWIQGDKNNNAWVTSCPKEHSALNARQFPVIAQTYFGVAHGCLEGLVG